MPVFNAIIVFTQRLHTGPVARKKEEGSREVRKKEEKEERRK